MAWYAFEVFQGGAATTVAMIVIHVRRAQDGYRIV